MGWLRWLWRILNTPILESEWDRCEREWFEDARRLIASSEKK